VWGGGAVAVPPSLLRTGQMRETGPWLDRHRLWLLLLLLLHRRCCLLLPRLFLLRLRPLHLLPHFRFPIRFLPRHAS
jgi:hypothetical protein